MVTNDKKWAHFAVCMFIFFQRQQFELDIFCHSKFVNQIIKNSVNEKILSKYKKEQTEIQNKRKTIRKTPRISRRGL